MLTPFFLLFLCNICATIVQQLVLKLSHAYAAVAAGELDRVAGWLRERVFSIASLKDPDEWIRAITGESLNTDYYLSYLEKKYAGIYGLRG